MGRLVVVQPPVRGKGGRTETYLIANHRLRLFVVQDRHGETILIIRIRFEVNLTQVMEVRVHRIRHRILTRELVVLGREHPSSLTHMPVHRTERNDILQPFQLPRNQRPMRPGARIRYIKMIPPFLRREPRPFFLRNPVPEFRFLSLEFTALITGFNPVRDTVRLVLLRRCCCVRHFGCCR